MARTQKNKNTMGHLGLLKARLAKLRRELIEPKGGTGGGGEGFDVAKTGDARIGFVGFPSVGKSTLLCNLAGVYSEVAAYEFTTLTTVPGVIRYKGAKIQLLDLPGIIEGAKDGKGRGKQVIAENELEGFGIRLNKSPPNITLRRKEKGGLNIQSLVPQSELDKEVIKTILSEYKIHNADVSLRCDATAEDLIDVIEGSRVYIPCIYVLNKIDQITIEELDIICRVPHCVPISAHHKWNFDDLLELIWEYLNLIRIYTKPKGQLPDYNAPVILRSASHTVEDFCNKLHKTLIKEFKYAFVWGSSVKHQPQRVGKDHILHDEDVVQIVKNDLPQIFLYELLAALMQTSTDFISKSKREKCWKSRDAFWECVTDVIAKNSEPDDKLIRKQCTKQRKLYEEMCPRIWILTSSHIDEL
ncbi:uncharacterized protein DC041_0009165 [Schistosoma bovis]|uniref:Developmentally-regulated GTP-binding protein 1 n=1 Tax=Schistosoma bovis TaxID=6184 RepID=A0A430QDZ4_SCHBO|nr:uncharacterized protein DC041_0009165 [Schistosoma bovis]